MKFCDFVLSGTLTFSHVTCVSKCLECCLPKKFDMVRQTVFSCERVGLVQVCKTMTNSSEEVGRVDIVLMVYLYLEDLFLRKCTL